MKHYLNSLGKLFVILVTMNNCASVQSKVYNRDEFVKTDEHTLPNQKRPIYGLDLSRTQSGEFQMRISAQEEVLCRKEKIQYFHRTAVTEREVDDLHKTFLYGLLASAIGGAVLWDSSNNETYSGSEKFLGYFFGGLLTAGGVLLTGATISSAIRSRDSEEDRGVVEQRSVHEQACDSIPIFSENVAIRTVDGENTGIGVTDSTGELSVFISSIESFLASDQSPAAYAVVGDQQLPMVLPFEIGYYLAEKRNDNASYEFLLNRYPENPLSNEIREKLADNKAIATIRDARTAERKGDIRRAAKLYQEAIDLSPENNNDIYERKFNEFRKRIPLSKITDMQTARLLYPPTVSSILEALFNPDSAKGKRIYMFGEIVQNLGFGYLIQISREGNMVLLDVTSNPSISTSYVDRSVIEFLATIAGTYTYTTVIGHYKTIPKFEAIFAAPVGARNYR